MFIGKGSPWHKKYFHTIIHWLFQRHEGALTFRKPGTLMVRRIFLKAPGSDPRSPSASVTCSSIALTLAPTIFTKACSHTRIICIRQNSDKMEMLRIIICDNPH